MPKAIPPCPLAAHFKSNPIVDADTDLITEFREAALGGDVERVYSYALLLHQLMFDTDTYFMFQDVPPEVFNATLKQSYEMFERTAFDGYPDGMLFTGWCKLMGFGTAKNVREAQVWFDAARQYLDDDMPMVRVMEHELNKARKDGLVPKPYMN